jgi:HEAT repeat protein/predicted  nucleic acid-binding Zn-ribbon protein
MSIRSTCSACGRVYALGDHLAGKTVRCKECGATFEVRALARREEAGGEESETGRSAAAEEQIQTQPHSPKGPPLRSKEEPPRRRRRDRDEPDVRRPRRGNRGMLIGLIVGGSVLALLLVGTLIAVLVFSGRSRNKDRAADSGGADPFVDVSGSWPQPMPIRAAPGTCVVLRVAGLSNEWTDEAFSDQLQGLVSTAGSFAMSSTASGDRKTFVVAPVLDVQAFSRRLDFCTVRTVDNGIITVVAHKVEGPPPNADPVTKALYRLKSINARRRAEGIRKLKEAPPDARREEVAKALTPLLNDRDASVRREAIETLGAWEDKDKIVPTLLPALRDRETRQTALKVLGRLKDGLPEARRREVARALEPLLGVADVSVRCEGIDALGTWGDKESVPALLQALRDKETRVNAIKALGPLKDERAAEPITKSLEDFFEQGAAVEALKQMGPAAETAVLPLLNHRDAGRRAQACDILKVIGTRQSLPFLAKVAAENNIFSSPAAKEAIRAIQARQ